MSKMIQIRNVPDEVHRRLKSLAAQQGLTLSDFLLREARKVAERPTLEEMLARIAARPKAKLKLSSARIIREARDSR